MHPLAEAAIDWALEELLSGLQVEWQNRTISFRLSTFWSSVVLLGLTSSGWPDWTNIRPYGRLFTLGSFFESYKSNIFVLLFFLRIYYVLNLTQNVFSYILVHPVLLATLSHGDSWFRPFIIISSLHLGTYICWVFNISVFRLFEVFYVLHLKSFQVILALPIFQYIQICND
jgi:hypothetical protein